MYLSTSKSIFYKEKTFLAWLVLCFCREASWRKEHKVKSDRL